MPNLQVAWFRPLHSRVCLVSKCWRYTSLSRVLSCCAVTSAACCLFCWSRAVQLQLHSCPQVSGKQFVFASAAIHHHLLPSAGTDRCHVASYQQ